MKNRQRRANFESKRRAEEAETLHTCTECGATEQTHPERDFRYKVVDGDAVCLCNECRTSP